MITNRRPLSASFEPRETSAAEPHWVGLELSDKQAVVRGKRILVVDDEEPLRACLRMMLELDGHRVTEARNGAEALNLLTTAEFDLVITDFEMPVMKGNELALSIKLLAPALPVLMITGSERARLDAANPADALLNKPFTLPDLRCALGRLLSAVPDPAQASAVLVYRVPAYA